MEDDIRFMKLPVDCNGNPLNIYDRVSPTRNSYEFKRGTVLGYKVIDEELYVIVGELTQAYTDAMLCEPRLLDASAITVDGLLRDYVIARDEGDAGEMERIGNMLEVKDGAL